MLEITSYQNHELSRVSCYPQCSGYCRNHAHNQEVLSRMCMILQEDLIHKTPRSTPADNELGFSGSRSTNRQQICWPLRPEQTVGEEKKKLFVTNHLTIKVRVPERVVGLVVGPKGATIKRIQRITNTFIITPSKNCDPVFTITGTEENVSEAKDHIKMHIINRTGSAIEPNIVIESSVKCDDWSEEYLSPSLQSSEYSGKEEESENFDNCIESSEFQKIMKKPLRGSLSAPTLLNLVSHSSNSSLDRLPHPVFANHHAYCSSQQRISPFEGKEECRAVASSPPMTYSVVGYPERIGVEQILEVLEAKMKLDGIYLKSAQRERTTGPKKDVFCIMCFRETDEKNHLLSCDHSLCGNCVRDILSGDSHCPICRKQIVTPEYS